MKQDQRTWSSLPHDILSLIVSHLLVGDVVAFHAVCKWWRETPRPMITKSIIPYMSNEAPFLMCPSNKLFHPVFKYSHIQEIYDLPRAYICASHCDWSLMTLSECSLFFFNPFTNEKVNLPDIPLMGIYCPKLIFSSPPTSQGCLVFGVEHLCCDKEINIYTIKIGELDWTTNTIYCLPHFRLSSCNPIFFKSEYYCLGKAGSLLIYDPRGKRPRWVDPPKPPIQRNQSIPGCRYYMVESQGKLLLVFTNNEKNWVNVARLDTTKRTVWEKIGELGDDTMLFVSQVTSFSAKSTVRGTGNKIYFPMFVGDTDNQLFYSLATHKYHSFDGRRSSNNFHEIRLYPNSTWIKRPSPSSL